MGPREFADILKRRTIPSPSEIRSWNCPDRTLVPVSTTLLRLSK